MVVPLDVRTRLHLGRAAEYRDNTGARTGFRGTFLPRLNQRLRVGF